MDLITPGIGLLFWTSIVFVLLLVLLSKFAWKPILGMVQKREASINESLDAAESARKELTDLEINKKAIMDETKVEKNRLIDEGKAIQAEIVKEAKDKARLEDDKIIETARKEFGVEKEKAMENLKKDLALLSIEVASKVIEEELSTTKKHEAIINQMLEKANFN